MGSSSKARKDEPMELLVVSCPTWMDWEQLKEEIKVDPELQKIRVNFTHHP